MSQPMQDAGVGGGDEDDQKQKKRRSSILMMHAKKGGLVLSGNELLRGLPTSLQQRLSNGPKMVPKSGSKMTAPSGSVSSIPRPRFKPIPVSSITKSKNSVLGSQTQKQPAGILKSRTSVKTLIAQPTSINAAQNSATQLRQPTKLQQSVGRDKTFSSKRSNTSMRRTMSVDSNVWAQSMITPGSAGLSMISKSPGSIRRWGSQTYLSGNAQGKGIKLPAVKDTKVLNNLMECVYSFLMEYGYQPLPATPSDLKQTSTNNLYSMIIFVAESLVGPKYFATKDDQLSKIIEMAVFLRYPLPISKSNLKSATAPHTFPATITFLAWLCCRVQACYKQKNENPINNFLNECFPEIALENCLRLFCANLRINKNLIDGEGSPEMTEMLEDELLEFKNKVSERFMGEWKHSLEEFREQKNETEQELKQLEGVHDPSKDVQETLDTAEKKLQDTKTRIQEARNRIAQYQNVHSLHTQEESLKHEVQLKQFEIDQIKSELDCQPMTKESEGKILSEINDIQKQRECLKTMLVKLENDLEEKQSTLNELDEQFRETILNFTVVETFNANLSNLTVNGCSVPVNPFTPQELDEWLNIVSNIHETIEKASQSQTNVLKTEQRKLENANARAKEELISWSQKANTKKAYVNFSNSGLDNQERKNRDEFSALEDEVSKLSDKVEDKKKEVENSEAQIASKRKLLAEYRKKRNGVLAISEKWDKAVEDAQEEILFAEAECAAETQYYSAKGWKMVRELQKDKKALRKMIKTGKIPPHKLKNEPSTSTDPKEVNNSTLNCSQVTERC